MSQTIEIEFKNMLTKEEYEKFITLFSIHDSDIFTQENHYFDTVDFALKEQGAALRIRKKGNKYEMTLKQPASVGLLETNQVLSMDEATTAISKGILPNGNIQGIIAEMNIPFSKLLYFGSLTTKRAEFKYKNGLLVLDHSYYLNKEDFEVEYEVENYQDGKLIFLQLLKHHGIPNRETDNKIRRFYRQKYEQMN